MKELWDILTNTDPGILAFGAVVFLPGFILAGAIVYFILRGIVRSLAAPSRQRKENRAKQREQRKWDDFYHALDNCTADNVSPLPADTALIQEALGYYSSMHRRKLSEREQFICYKRLEQLGVHKYADLAWLYADHFSDTDRDTKAALKYTGILADQNYPEWMMNHARLLLKFKKDEQSIRKAMELYRKVCKTDEDPYLPLPENEEYGPEAAWRLSKLCLQHDTSEMLDEGHRMVYLAALCNHAQAIQYMKDLKEHLLQDRKSLVTFAAFLVKADTEYRNDPEDGFAAVKSLLPTGFHVAYGSASTFYGRIKTDDQEDHDWRHYCLNRLGAALGSNFCRVLGALSLLLGEGRVPSDADQGMKWLQQAVQEDYPDAFSPLAHLLIFKDEENKAVGVLERGVEKGSAECAQELQKIYELGKGSISPDAEKAAHWKNVAEQLQLEKEKQAKNKTENAH